MIGEFVVTLEQTLAISFSAKTCRECDTAITPGFIHYGVTECDGPLTERYAVCKQCGDQLYQWTKSTKT